MEILNHGIRDNAFGEDRTPSRRPRLVANLALLRNAALRLCVTHKPEKCGYAEFLTRNNRCIDRILPMLMSRRCD